MWKLIDLCDVSYFFNELLTRRLFIPVISRLRMQENKVKKPNFLHFVFAEQVLLLFFVFLRESPKKKRKEIAVIVF